jgi:predicted nucleic acid-binding protein
MHVKVVDASIMAAWCFRESRAAEAFAILRDSELHAPPLLAYELASIARKKAITYPDKVDLLIQALRTVLVLPVHWDEVDHTIVMQLAIETGLTTYDASYLYVARTTKAELVTFDEQLAKINREAQ